MASNDTTTKSLNHISSDLYDQLVFYFKYASSAYSLFCLRPNGNHLVTQISNPLTDIEGFIARDNVRKEIVVAIRGSASVTDVLMDSQIILVPFFAPGAKLADGAKVHSGFLVAWDSISIQVITIVGKELRDHPEYSVVTVGHSLGGSIALLGVVTLQQNFKNVRMRTYSYGAPRTGNKTFSDYVNATFGENAYRVVHGNDGVPTMIPTKVGYHHHGVEYWQYTHPASGDTTTKCNADGEDPCCSAAIHSRGVTLDHTNYFGILVSTPFCI